MHADPNVQENDMTTSVHGAAALLPPPARGQPERRAPLAGALLLLALAACRDNGGGKAPALQALTVAPAPAYLAVGATQQLTATGRFADGGTGAVTAGLAWQSSDPGVAAVDASGLVKAIAAGTARITATHGSGLAASADVVARVQTAVAAGDPPRAARVEAALGYFKVSGLTPGAFYAPSLTQLDDDVDLAVYADPSLSEAALLCASQNVGTTPESCVAPASAAGELYLVVDGTWSEAGADFVLSIDAPAPAATKASLTLAQLPLGGSVDTGEVDYKVSGLNPGGRYAVRISGLSADADLEVFGDAYQYASLCASFLSGRVDDACTAAANAAGELFVEVDGESTASGASFTLSVTPAS